MLIAAVALAACTSDSGGPQPVTTSTVGGSSTVDRTTELDLRTTTTLGPQRLSVRTTPLGDIVVDDQGMTLYAQALGIIDGCTGTCLDAWPALWATTVSAGGIDAAIVSITVDAPADATTATGPEDAADDPDDPGGATAPPTTAAAPSEGVVTIAGRQLHRFVGDAVPGDTTGQGFNDTWYVVAPDGTLIRPTASTTSTTSTP